jgi:hypothetical protein
MLSEDGGVCTTSLSVRRSRSRRGVFPGGMRLSRFGAARFVRCFATFFATFFAGFVAPLRRGEAFRDRTAPRRVADWRFFVGFARRVALRLAIRSTPRLLYHVRSFELRRAPNLDSLPISVVRSDAYRNFGKPRGVPDPSEPTPGNRPGHGTPSTPSTLSHVFSAVSATPEFDFRSIEEDT